MHYARDLQTTARRLNLASNTISSGPRSIMSIIKDFIYQKFVDLVEIECNIVRNNYIT